MQAGRDGESDMGRQMIRTVRNESRIGFGMRMDPAASLEANGLPSLVLVYRHGLV